MSDFQPEAGSSRDEVGRSSSSRHDSRSDRDARDTHRDHRSRSHREHRDKDSRSSRHRDHERPRSRSPHRHRSSRDAEASSSSRSKRSRDDDGHRRRHRDDAHHSSRRDDPPRSDRHSHPSSRRSKDHAESSSHRRLSPSATRSRSRSRSPPRRSEPLDLVRSATASATPSARPIETEVEDDVDDDAPNFAPSGLLAAESNMVNGVALKYHEPPEARKPKTRWRLYCFKDGKEQQLLHLGSQSAYLLGRDRNVVDIPLDHESCSKQHAVVQFRQLITTNEFGDKKKRIHPFLIDLESSNGSYVNDTEIPTSRYYQLRTGDTLTFGASTREYVLLDESAA